MLTEKAIIEVFKKTLTHIQHIFLQKMSKK